MLPRLSCRASSRLHREFEVLGELGRGAFGRALRARRRADGMLLCLKALDTQGMGHHERRMVSLRLSPVRPVLLPMTAALPACLTTTALLHHAPTQARGEVRVLAALNHPNIVRYEGCWREGGWTFVAMELCEVRGRGLGEGGWRQLLVELALRCA